jgi:hypothetical protein
VQCVIGIAVLFVSGLIVGALVKFLMAGDDRGGIAVTSILGILAASTPTTFPSFGDDPRPASTCSLRGRRARIRPVRVDLDYISKMRLVYTSINQIKLPIAIKASGNPRLQV